VYSTLFNWVIYRGYYTFERRGCSKHPQVMLVMSVLIGVGGL